MDQLNVAANERIDLSDFQFATNSVPSGLVNEVTASFLVNAGQNWVVSGFAPSIVASPLSVQVGDNITPNVGLLGQRSGGSIAFDVMCAAGTASQTVALSSFAAGTYGLFIRYTRNPASAAQRVYWDGTNSREYTQLTNTRNAGQFEVRVESVAPSGEWLQIATIVIAGASGSTTATLTDQRPMYFEGTSAASYAPTWGSTADRVSNRLTKPIGDLRTMIDALKAAIVDIKGPGLAQWFTGNVQGLNIGTGFGGAAPTADRLNIGETSNNLRRYVSGGTSFYELNLGSNSSIKGDNSSPLSSYLTVYCPGSISLVTASLYLADATYNNRVFPTCQVWAAGLINSDLSRRTTGNSPSVVPTLVNGVYTITFGSAPPAGAFVLTQPVSNDATATGYSCFGVINGGGQLQVRMSRGSATVSTTPPSFYYAIIYGP